MKVFQEIITVPVEWKFACDGQTLRSNVVGGFQGEIFKSRLKVIGRDGSIYSEWYVGTRKYGMKKFSNVVSAVMSGRT